MKKALGNAGKKLKKHWKRNLILGLVLLGAGAAVVHHRIAANAFKEQAQMTSYETVQRQDLKKSITINGTIASLQKVDVTSELSDTEVMMVNVNVGDTVTKGQLIAQLDTSSLERQLKLAEAALENIKNKNQSEISQADRAVSNASQALQSEANQGAQDIAQVQDKIQDNNVDLLNAQQDISTYVAKEAELQGQIDKAQDTYDSEQRVLRKKQRKLSRIQQGEADDDNDGSSDTSKLSVDITDLENAQTDRQKHIDDLKSKLQEAQSKRTAAEEKLKTAQDNSKSLTSELSKNQNAAQDTNRNNQKSLEDSKSQAGTARLSAESEQMNAQNEVDKIKEQIQKATIVAPIDGIVTGIEVQEGKAYKGEIIATIQNTAGYKVSAEVNQYDVSDVSQGMRAAVTTKTTGDLEMPGTLSFVAPLPSTTTSVSNNTTTTSSSGNYPVEITLQDPNDRLRLGMSAKVTIIEDEKPDALTVPISTITTDADGTSSVTVVGADGSETQIPVTVDLKTDYYAAVTGDGLNEGDQLKPADTMEAAEGDGTDGGANIMY
ncbi:MAG: HlyD family efflux transporter periplasmic adaptor subunit [Oribacterium sp.]|nr:HlyD family efflux transporter periplasmic adaptor subunit [Oribacterium sp.]